MDVATVRLYGDLKGLAGAPADGRVEVSFHATRSSKDLVESLGVPHTEVGLLLVDGRAVDFDAPVRTGQRVTVYPWLGTVAVPPGPRLRPPTPRPVRFLLDVHLGRLARRLRTLGLDSAYDPKQTDDAHLAERAAAQGRVLLTRDRELLMRDVVVHGALIRSEDADEQTLEVMRRFDVTLEPFTRCVNCNGPLRGVPKREVLDELPPRTRVEHDTFSRCGDCGQVYWPGSHRDRMDPFVVRAQAEAALARWRRVDPPDHDDPREEGRR